MKSVYKWRVLSSKYLYLTNEDNTQPFIYDKTTGERTYPGGITSSTPVDEGAIEQIVSTITVASDYEAKYLRMVDLAMTDSDARKITFLSYDNYFNLDNDECVEEALTPKCEGYEPVFNVSAYTLDNSGATEVEYTFFGERNESNKTINYNLNLGIPRGLTGEKGEPGIGCKGDKGDDGENAEIEEITADANGVEYGTPASAMVLSSITSAGTYKMNFYFDIPQGAPGEQGAPGNNGESGWDAVIKNVTATATALAAGDTPYAIVEPSSITVTQNAEDKTNETSFKIDFGIPRGIQGPQGIDGRNAEIRNVTARVVETLDPGYWYEDSGGTRTWIPNNAEAGVDVSPIGGGNIVDLDFWFKIPRGEKGDSPIGGGGKSIYYTFLTEVLSSSTITAPELDFDLIYDSETEKQYLLTLTYPSIWSSGVFTDELVKQTASNTDTTFPLLASNQPATSIVNGDYQSVYDTGIGINPNKHVIMLSTGCGIKKDSGGNDNTVWNTNGGTTTLYNREIQVSSTTVLTSVSTTPVNFVGGTNITVSGNPSNGTVTINANIPDAMHFIGTLGVNGTITSLPINGIANIGDTYKVITDDTYYIDSRLTPQDAKVGDLFICNGKDTTLNTNTWVYVPSGDDPSGTVTNITVGSGLTVAPGESNPITSSGTISHADTSSQSSVTNTDRTFIQSVGLDDFGHVTSLTSATIPESNSNREIQVDGDTVLDSGTTTPLNLSGGTGISLSADSAGTVTINGTTNVPKTEHELIYYDDDKRDNPYGGLFTQQLMYEDGIVVDNDDDFRDCTMIYQPNIQETFQQFSESPFSPEYGRGLSFKQFKHVAPGNEDTSTTWGYGYGSWKTLNDTGTGVTGNVIYTNKNSAEFNGYLYPHNHSTIVAESLIGSYDDTTSGDFEGITLLNTKHAKPRHIITSDGRIFYRNGMFDLNIEDSSHTDYCAWVYQPDVCVEEGAYVIYSGSKKVASSETYYWAAQDAYVSGITTGDTAVRYVSNDAGSIKVANGYDELPSSDLTDMYEDDFPPLSGNNVYYIADTSTIVSRQTIGSPVETNVTISTTHDASGYFGALTILTENTTGIDSIFAYHAKSTGGTVYVYGEIIPINNQSNDLSTTSGRSLFSSIREYDPSHDWQDSYQLSPLLHQRRHFITVNREDAAPGTDMNSVTTGEHLVNYNSSYNQESSTTNKAVGVLSHCKYKNGVLEIKFSKVGAATTTGRDKFNNINNFYEAGTEGTSDSTPLSYVKKLVINFKDKTYSMYEKENSSDEKITKPIEINGNKIEDKPLVSFKDNILYHTGTPNIDSIDCGVDESTGKANTRVNVIDENGIEREIDMCDLFTDELQFMYSTVSLQYHALNCQSLRFSDNLVLRADDDTVWRLNSAETEYEIWNEYTARKLFTGSRLNYNYITEKLWYSNGGRIYELKASNGCNGGNSGGDVVVKGTLEADAGITGAQLIAYQDRAYGPQLNMVDYGLVTLSNATVRTFAFDKPYSTIFTLEGTSIGNVINNTYHVAYAFPSNLYPENSLVRIYQKDEGTADTHYIMKSGGTGATLFTSDASVQGASFGLIELLLGDSVEITDGDGFKHQVRAVKMWTLINLGSQGFGFFGFTRGYPDYQNNFFHNR